MLLMCRRQMSVTEINENQVLNWNTKIQIITKSYLKTLKTLKKPKFWKHSYVTGLQLQSR